jgi:hypothetical protein
MSGNVTYCNVRRVPQRSDLDQFLFETTVNATVKETLDALVEVHNLRHRIAVLKVEGEELAKYGPAKLPDQQGIDEFSEAPLDKGPHYVMDPTGRRTGNGEELHSFIMHHAPHASWLHGHMMRQAGGAPAPTSGTEPIA